MTEEESNEKRSKPPENPSYDDRFDAIVVGAGLAGSASAITMAREGLDVLMIERGAYPGAKNVFGGVMYTPTVRELADMDDAPLERYVAEKRYAMLTEEDEVAASVSIGDWHEEPHNDSFTILRGDFDEWFAQQAVDEGATLITETTVTDLIKDDGRVVGVETDRPDGTIRAPVVVLGEGGNSLVSEGADLKEADAREDVAVAVKEVLEWPEDGVIENRFRVSDDDGVAYHYFGEGVVEEAFGGAFVYTNDKTVSVGLAYRIEDSVNDMLSPDDMLDKFKSHPSVAPLFSGARTVEYTAKTIPEGGASAMPELVHDGALLVGDTAGLVLNNGIHLEGTNMAVESGYHAGNAVVEAFESNASPSAATVGADTATAADGGVDIRASDLQSYPRNLNDSFVVENLEHYEWLVHNVTQDKELLFKDVPNALADAAEEYFKIDRTPKQTHGKRAKKRMMQTVGGLRGMIKLGWRYRKLIR